jgi:DUF1680 family protein
LNKLPAGSVRPEGWLRHQLELMAQGLTGRLPEISPYCRFDGNAWASVKGEGQAWWEELPYWLRGYTALAFALQNERMIDEARRWINAMLASQRADGYFGPRANLSADYAEARYLPHPSPDLWPNMVALFPLRTYYEATGDERILRFMTEYFRWQAKLPLPEFLPGRWSQWRAGDNLDSIFWLYNRTGEPWLLDLARVTHERSQDWVGGIPRWHGVGLAQGFREPAQFFQLTHDVRYLQATEDDYRAIYSTYGQVPGGMYGADEVARPGFTDARQGTETCSIVEMMRSAQMLARITGNPVWADRCEDAAFNSLPAAFTPDLKALHYLTSPNQIQLDRTSKAPFISNGGEQFPYNPHEYRCCQHNSGIGWPFFSENLWMASETGGLAAVLYAPSRLTAKVGRGSTVTITETTAYPFGDRVDLAISLSASTEFPLLLRIPGWCKSPAVAINGKPVRLPTTPRGWILIERAWRNGDRVTIEFPADVRLTVWESNRKSVSISRGALTFSLKIGERWQRYGGTDDWPAHEVYPSTPWNYGLILDSEGRPEGLRVVKSDSTPLQPFQLDQAPIRLFARARRIPSWIAEDNGLVGEVPLSPTLSHEPIEEIPLIPMGAARLRVSAFPVAGHGPEAKPWSADTVIAVASYCWPSDTPRALFDGIVPQNSADATVPRFSWWDRTGTREWVEYYFREPRKIGRSGVYWADDSGSIALPPSHSADAAEPPPDDRLLPFWKKAGGGLRIPAAWRLVWWDGSRWREVSNGTGYRLDKNRFNEVEFTPVVTRSIRLEAELQPRHSAGVLEWRVMER